MDINKNHIKGTLVILVLLAFLPLGSAAAGSEFWDGIEFSELDFIDHRFYTYGTFLEDGIPEDVQIQGNIELESIEGYPNADGIIFWKIVAVDANGNPTGTGNTNAELQNIYLFSYNLQTGLGQSTWLNDGYVWYVDLIGDFSVDTSDWIEQNIFTITGQDHVHMEGYIPVVTWTIPPQTCTDLENGTNCPNTALAGIANETENLIMSGFDIFNLMIIITGMMFLFFIIVFFWKLLEYFITRVALRRE